ncbi:hypothetical protein [Dyadobacter bucti]|uniref:hypothetical protein n=1 Tax=Dyadobacter bucti TaxID=2572203 RepID=UPI003F72E55E
MKQSIIFFLLYILYDAYMRQRDKDKYLTKEEFKTYKADVSGALSLKSGSNVDALITRIEALENSPYA